MFNKPGVFGRNESAARRDAPLRLARQNAGKTKIALGAAAG